GLRRRRIEFARTAACGAPAGRVGAALVLATAAASLLAGCVGVPLGIAAAHLLLPLLEPWSARHHGPLVLAPDALFAAPLLAVLAALAAAAPSIARVVRETGDVRPSRELAPSVPSMRRAWLGIVLF